MRNAMSTTGASRGVDATTALLTAECGYAVILNYLRNRGAAEVLYQHIECQGGGALMMAVDVTEEGDIERSFVAIDERSGRLDALVNNADVPEAQMRLENTDAARLRRIFAVSVTGSFLCAREAVKRLSIRHGRRGGSVINISSMASRLGPPNEYINYAAAKGVIDSITIGLAREVAAEDIRVSAMRPGLTDIKTHTGGGELGCIGCLKGSIPLGRGGTAEEAA